MLLHVHRLIHPSRIGLATAQIGLAAVQMGLATFYFPYCDGEKDRFCNVEHKKAIGFNF